MAQSARTARAGFLPSVLHDASSQARPELKIYPLEVTKSAPVLTLIPQSLTMSDHCNIFAKSLAQDAEWLAASKNYDAARAWSLLGSRAQNVLKALCAAGAASVSTVSTEPAALAAATRPRPVGGLARCPEDVLGAIIAFVDLPMRFTCVAACSTLRDACARLSPRLEHSLLAKRFPLINSFGSAGAPAPQDLFRTFKDFEGGNTYAVRPKTSIALNAYQLSLEIEAKKIERAWGTQESIYVGTGELQSIGLGNVTYKFTVPEAVRERVVQLPESESWILLATVVASRRGASGKLQYAKLYQENCSLHENGQLDFDSTEMPLLAGSNPALNFIKFQADNTDMWTDPVLELLHNAESGSVEARFTWKTPNDIVDMTAHDARACLEHYVAWSD